MCRRPSCLAG
jgi:ketosteroid isomerase-like protein